MTIPRSRTGFSVDPDGQQAWMPYSGKPDSPEQLGPPGTHRARVMEERIHDLEAALATAQAAIAGLSARVGLLERQQTPHGTGDDVS